MHGFWVYIRVMSKDGKIVKEETWGERSWGEKDGKVASLWRATLGIKILVHLQLT
jgi:hypothetical protein